MTLHFYIMVKMMYGICMVLVIFSVCIISYPAALVLAISSDQ